MNSRTSKFRHFREFSIRIDQKPYELTEQEKSELRDIFRSVMTNLAFFAREVFVDRLFGTEFIARIFDKNNRVVGFANAIYRDCGGIRVVHFLSVYVIPTFHATRVLHRLWRFFIVEQGKANNYCRETPLYFTASTVNVQLLYALGKVCPIWPDLKHDTPVPDEIRRIAEGANQFYPAPGDRLFQVKITEEFAGLKDGVGHDTSDENFNRKFHALADASKLELVFFVGRLDAAGLDKLVASENGTQEKIPAMA